MFYIALKIILYDKLRSFFTLLGVVFAVSLIFAQVGIYQGLMEASSVLIDHTAGDIWVTSKNSKNFDFCQPFPEYFYYSALQVPGVQSVDKAIIGWGMIRQQNGGQEQVEIMGYQPDRGVGGPWDLKEGRPSDVKNGNFMIVDESAVKRLGAFKVGDYRDVMARRIQIMGISRGVKSFTTAPYLFTSYSLAQELVTYVGHDNTVFLIIKTLPGSDKGTVIRLLREKLPAMDVLSKEEFSSKTRLYWTIETGVGFSFLLTIMVSFFIGMLIVGQTIYNSTIEHIKEYGTMKALGASTAEISRIIVSQAAINALVGYSVSLLVTLASVKMYEAGGMVMVVKTSVNLIILLMTMLMCLCSAFYSIKKIKNIDPAILFRG
ncbi:ABC transporter permease [Geomesophilobacter sediminis]|uniref:ABC transporter permease n=1 Tax=Geomesophilobacter sediminis TaxID=2798584 RepID=A0A8J7M071_9BACT|nr:ABC transporter permease [Geomesophilobacter sediminis]MBJ6723657.1 ABC transporter permease [Geomesophilobacter sediminis]